MATKSKRLTLLSDAEQFALYGLPDFDDGQQSEYLSMSEAELALACSRPGLTCARASASIWKHSQVRR
jgi:hypothetical protein